VRKKKKKFETIIRPGRALKRLFDPSNTSADLNRGPERDRAFITSFIPPWVQHSAFLFNKWPVSWARKLARWPSSKISAFYLHIFGTRHLGKRGWYFPGKPPFTLDEIFRAALLTHVMCKNERKLVFAFQNPGWGALLDFFSM
jgi:hypothetical protein